MREEEHLLLLLIIHINKKDVTLCPAAFCMTVVATAVILLFFRGLMRLWTRFQLMGVPVSCLNPADAAFVRRRDPSCAMKSYR